MSKGNFFVRVVSNAGREAYAPVKEASVFINRGTRSSREGKTGDDGIVSLALYLAEERVQVHIDAPRDAQASFVNPSDVPCLDLQTWVKDGDTIVADLSQGTIGKEGKQ